MESVLAQTYEDCEVVIADHSSADATGEIVESFRADPRIRVLTPTPRGGGARANWNRVSQESSGEWIKLVCADDVLDPDAVARQLSAVDAHPSAVMAASQRRIIDDDGRVIVKRRGLAGLDGVVDGRDAIRAAVRAGANLFGEPVCTLMRRDVLAAVGWWTDAFPYLIDQATYTAVLAHGDLVAVREPLASFRVSQTQWSVRLARRQAAHAIAFHRHLRRAEPGLLTASDVALGNAQATRVAIMRRLVYAGLAVRQRLTRPAAVD